MVGNNIYFNDYKSGYIGLRDIPYKYWDKNLVEYALKKEPAAYYEKLLEYTLAGETRYEAFWLFKNIPDKYKSLRLYRVLAECGDDKCRCLIPQEVMDKLSIKALTPEELLVNFKNIAEKNRTPAMYRTLSHVSFDDYLVYAVKYPNIPDEKKTKKTCLSLFYNDIEKYALSIPDAYKSVELGELLVSIDFKKFFPSLPEHCRTSEMYEKYVATDPATLIEEVPKEKRTQKMYAMLFDYTLDTYLDKIPKEYMTKEMYHRLIRINPGKYLPLTPIKFLDQEIAIYLLNYNSNFLNLLPQDMLTVDFFLGLIKKDPQKYIDYLPEQYYSPAVIDKIAMIIGNHDLTFKLYCNTRLVKLILEKYPHLLTKFYIYTVYNIILEELIAMCENGMDISDIMKKYSLPNGLLITRTMNYIKKNHNQKYDLIHDYLNSDKIYQRYIGIANDLRALEDIIISLGKIEHHKLNLEQKVKFAYLTNRMLNSSLEELYAYNNSNRNKEVSNIVNSFIGYVLHYTLYADTCTSTMDLKKMTYNNPWLEDFNYYKFFGYKNNKATSKHMYGDETQELTEDIAKEVIELLKENEIPMNSLIVNVAFRKYFSNELDDYINQLKSYDINKDKIKRKKR